MWGFVGRLAKDLAPDHLHGVRSSGSSGSGSGVSTVEPDASEDEPTLIYTHKMFDISYNGDRVGR